MAEVTESCSAAPAAEAIIYINGKRYVLPAGRGEATLLAFLRGKVLHVFLRLMAGHVCVCRYHPCAMGIVAQRSMVLPRPRGLHVGPHASRAGWAGRPLALALACSAPHAWFMMPMDSSLGPALNLAGANEAAR